MEIDTGASLSIISEKTFQSIWFPCTWPKLQNSRVKLHTYTEEALKVLGSIEVEVTYKEQRRSMPLLVVVGEGPSLLGRGWLAKLKLDWQELYQILRGQQQSKNGVQDFKISRFH